MAETDDDVHSDDEAGDQLLVLVVRYLDGDLNAAELHDLNRLLRSDATSRRRFIELCTHGCLIRETFEPERQALLRHEATAAQAALAEDRPFPVKPKRRRSRRVLVLTGSALMIAALVLLGLWATHQDESPSIIGSLEQIAGDAHVLSAEGEVRLAEATSPIKAGDTIRVHGARSEAVFLHTDGTKVELLGDNTSITCGSRGSKSYVLHQGTLSVSARPQQQGHPLLFATSAAQLTVLGTQFFVEASADQTDLSVLEGHVRVTRVSDGKAVEVEKGKRLRTAEREDLAVQDIRQPPDAWALDFEDGLPKNFVRGRFVNDGLPTGSKGAVAALQADHGKLGVFHEIGTPENWYQGLFAVHEDSHFHFTYRMDQPNWINVFIIARGPDATGPHTGNYLFAEPIFQGHAGKWQTLTIPLSEFRRAGAGKGPPPSSDEIAYMVLFSSDADRGLVIDRMSVTRGGPGVVQFQDVE